jgi:hypothetical protein
MWKINSTKRVKKHRADIVKSPLLSQNEDTGT